MFARPIGGRWRLVVVLAIVAAMVVAIDTAPVDANSYPHDVVVNPDPVDFTPHAVDGRVYAIATVGERVIVGGTFTQVKEAGNPTVFTRNYLFAFDRTTGALDTGFVPVLDSPVESLAAAPDGTSVFVGGKFATVNGVANFGITKLDVATGQMVPGFNATTAGKVRDIVVHDNTVYLGGDIWSINGVARSRLGAVNATTGALDTTFTVGTTAPRVSVDWVTRLDISPDGSQMVILGNFLEVDGLDRKQIAMIDLSGPQAVVADWSTEQFGAGCSGSFWTYMRDVEYSVAGEFFAVVTTGGPFTGTLCDTASRWESADSGANLLETWADWSGGDTLTAVAVSNVAIYIGGHQRWMNNHLGRDQARPGAVSRAGIAALDIVNGVPLSWNPGKARGVAVWDLHLSDAGLYVGSDTDFTAGEYHAKLAQFPLEGGSPIPLIIPATLPTTMFTGEAGTTLTARVFDGTTFGADSPVASNVINWDGVGGAFHEGDRLYYTEGAALASRTFDGVAMGSAATEPSWADWSGTTAAAWNDGRLYYTQSGSSQLRYRYFSIESGIVGSQTFTLSDGLNWSSVVALDFAGGNLYFALSNGDLWVVDVVDGVPAAGTQQLISGPGAGDGRNWNDNALFYLSTDVPPTITLTSPLEGAVVSGAMELTADATDDFGVTQVEFSVDGASVGIDTDGTDGWSVPWDSTTSPDGSASVSTTATDTLGQTTSDAANVSIDNLGPTVSITAPGNGATVSGVVGITADASDAVGVASVEFFVDAISVGVDSDGSDGWSAGWDSSTTTDGPAALSATATDTFGRTDSDAITVTVDNSGGGSVVMVVANPGAISSGETAVRSRLESLGFTVTLLDDHAATNADATGAAFVLVTSSANSNVLGVTFRNVAQPVWVAKPYSLDNLLMTGPTGGVDYGTMSSATVGIDSVGHPLAAGLSGTPSVTTSSKTMSFGIPGAGAEIIATASGRPTTFVYAPGATLVGGSAAAGCRLTSSIFQNAPTFFTADGWALFDAAATYAGANCEAVASPPTVAITAPADGAVVAGSITVSADAADTGGITQVEFFIGGSTLGTDTDGSDGWSVAWDTTGSPDGPATVSATATDTDDETATDAVAVTVDNTAAGIVVMVVKDGTNPSSHDRTVRDQLLGAGYTVNLVDDNGVTGSVAAGASFVIVASSVSASAVGTAFYNVGQPVWTAKPYLLDDMGMTGTSRNADYGTVKASTIAITDPGHMLAGGFSGDVAITPSNRSVSFGIPGAGAATVATVNGNPTIFAYQAGATLADGSAAAGCRLHFPIFQTAVNSYNADAWSLFHTAASYAAGGCS